MAAPGERERLERALAAAAAELAGAVRPDGFWEGRLSSSALATATAVSALAVAAPDAHRGLIRAGAEWLAAHENADGGWGDSPDSPSNLSTTMLAVAALRLAGDTAPTQAADRARSYVERIAGRSATDQVAAVVRAYGADRTFATPILMNCALAGLIDWPLVPPLPFELSLLPRWSYRFARLRVVSYALPALIAIGLCLHRRRPARSAVARLCRNLAEAPALRKLEAIQPRGGGFIEAVPLTSFVAMGLAAALPAHHPVIRRCVDFLARSARPDGSWPIDSNLSVWLTSNALVALAATDGLKQIDVHVTRRWLVEQQQRSRHPYTQAAPGGWSWTHLSGGVPDADDTARALLALALTGGADAAPPTDEERRAVAAGVRWLLRLQNRDGGWPTFCRGWGRLPFDRSSPDLTAHALQALGAFGTDARGSGARLAIDGGVGYLRRTQRPDGAWLPLWFGNQAAPGKENPVFGTAVVAPVLSALGEQACADGGAAFLVRVQNADGGWGAAEAVESSTEETALAVSALAQLPETAERARAVARGARRLVEQVESGAWRTPRPIGLYFSSLWYSEQLYPIIWCVEALGRVASRSRGRHG